MFEQYVKSGREAMEYIKRHREVAASVKEIAKEEHEEVKAYVFGSAVSGNFTAASDIDILLVFDEVDKDEAVELKSRIWRKIGFSVPLQLHVVTQREFKEWYLKFVDKLEEV